MLIPDGETQATIEYAQKNDGSVVPRKTHTVVISAHYAEPLKAVRTKERAGYSGPEMPAPPSRTSGRSVEHVRNDYWCTS